MTAPVCRVHGVAKMWHRDRGRPAGGRWRCRRCERERLARWYAANVERLREKGREYYAANAEQIRERHARYRAAQRERVAREAS
jgi:hypothetical protein